MGNRALTQEQKQKFKDKIKYLNTWYTRGRDWSPIMFQQYGDEHLVDTVVLWKVVSLVHQNWSTAPGFTQEGH